MELPTPGVEKLKALARPKIFQLSGPEVKVQDEIVDTLETLLFTLELLGKWPKGQTVICLGGINLDRLAEPRPGDPLLKIMWTWRQELELTEIPNPAIGTESFFKHLDYNGPLKKKIVDTAIGTLKQAGQIQYILEAGLIDRTWTVWVEIHYYRNRPLERLGLHKDTVGETVFFNLNYVNTSEIISPEFLFNPPSIPEHDEQMKRSLHPNFASGLDVVRRSFPVGDEIEVTKILPGGVIASVDELIHHSTPLYGSRKITSLGLAQFFEKTVPIRYAKAKKAYEKSQEYPFPLEKFVSKLSRAWKEAAESDIKTWYKIIELTKKNVTFDRTALSKIGLPQQMVDQIVDECWEGGKGFQEVQVRNTAWLPDSGVEKNFLRRVVPKGKPPLTRRMSNPELRKTLPVPTPGPRRFFRTWVRTVRR